MKIIIGCILLIFSLSDQVYAFGSHGGGGSQGGSSSSVGSAGSGKSGNTSGGISENGTGGSQGTTAFINRTDENPGGSIIGDYANAGPNMDGFVAVPEPATMLLLGSGLIGIVAYGRKKLL